MMKMLKAGKFILFWMIVGGMVFGLSWVMLPRIPDFYKEDNWDVVFFGTSQCYCTFDPEVFDQYGLKTYNRGRAQQTMDFTYYYVKDALEVSDVDVVVLEIFGMTYGEEDFLEANETVRDNSMNDFRYSDIKYEMIRDCVPKELQWEYLFPLDKYHADWCRFDYSSPKNLITSMSNRYYTENSERGFWGWTSSQAFEFPPMEVAMPYICQETCMEIYPDNLMYLERIYEMCQEHQARLILVRAPYPVDNKPIQITNTVEDWANAHGVELVNYTKLIWEIGLDPQTDSLDGGTHLNKQGADKVSDHFAKYLTGGVS